MKRLLPGQFVFGEALASAYEKLVQDAIKGMEDHSQAYKDMLKDIEERERRERLRALR